MSGVRQEPVAVLVVDDLPSFRQAAASMIALTDGFSLAGEVASGEEAIAFLEQRPVGLVLMDVNMPGLSGIETARWIRHRFPRIEVVLLSVYSVEDLSRDARAVGAAFCPKDRFGPDELEALWDNGGRARP